MQLLGHIPDRRGCAAGGPRSRQSVPCNACCRRGRKAARASLERGFGNRRAAPRTGDRCACPRWTDRATDDSIGRTTPIAPSHMQRTSFFRASNNCNDPSLAIAEYSTLRRERSKSEESVCVGQSLWIGCSRHRGIMPNFRTPSMTTFPSVANSHFVRNHPHFSAKTHP